MSDLQRHLIEHDKIGLKKQIIKAVKKSLGGTGGAGSGGQGPAGPNEVTINTTTNLLGVLRGNGINVEADNSDYVTISFATEPPSEPNRGQMYVNTTDNILYIFWNVWRSTGITLPSTEGLYMGMGAFTYNS